MENLATSINWLWNCQCLLTCVSCLLNTAPILLSFIFPRHYLKATIPSTWLFWILLPAHPQYTLFIDFLYYSLPFPPAPIYIQPFPHNQPVSTLAFKYVQISHISKTTQRTESFFRSYISPWLQSNIFIPNISQLKSRVNLFWLPSFLHLMHFFNEGPSWSHYIIYTSTCSP